VSQRTDSPTRRRWSIRIEFVFDGVEDCLNRCLLHVFIVGRVCAA